MSAASDLERLATMYAGSVMVAGADGTRVVSAADLQRAIAKRRQVLESNGHRNTALIGFEETTLTDRFTLVRAQFRWDFQFANGETATIALPSTFIVDRGGESPRIVLYMNEQDVVSAMRARELLPAIP